MSSAPKKLWISTLPYHFRSQFQANARQIGRTSTWALGSLRSGCEEAPSRRRSYRRRRRWLRAPMTCMTDGGGGGGRYRAREKKERRCSRTGEGKRMRAVGVEPSGEERGGSRTARVIVRTGQWGNALYRHTRRGGRERNRNATCRASRPALRTCARRCVRGCRRLVAMPEHGIQMEGVWHASMAWQRERGVTNGW
jgi:hypothetical protein